MLNIFLDRFRNTMSIFTPTFFNTLSNEQLYDFLKANYKYHDGSAFNQEFNFVSKYKEIQPGTGNYDYTQASMSVSIYKPESPNFNFNIDLHGGSFKCELYWDWDESIQFLHMLSLGTIPSALALESNSIIFNFKDRYVDLCDCELRTVTESDFIEFLNLVVSYIITSFAFIEYSENRGLVYE